MHLTEILILLENPELTEAAQPCRDLLDRFGLRYENRNNLSIREPDALRELAQKSEENGIKLFIVFSSSASALVTMISAYTILPVIGVPVSGSPLGGLDALYSMTQVPGGVPVATLGMGTDGAKNAAVLTAQILSLSDERLRDRLRFYKQNGCSFI
ncbi:MAG: AIR carboxylase family protein [Bacteroidetes bacterium]|nr:AIR carboxylase family protein [Bacteroidota bacterium]